MTEIIVYAVGMIVGCYITYRAAYRLGVHDERERQRKEAAKRRAEERIKHYVSPVVQATRWQRQVRPLIERDIETVVREAIRKLEG